MFNRSKWIKALAVALVMAVLMPNAALAAKPVIINSGEIVSGLDLVTGSRGGVAAEVSIDESAWQAARGGRDWSYNLGTAI